MSTAAPDTDIDTGPALPLHGLGMVMIRTQYVKYDAAAVLGADIQT